MRCLYCGNELALLKKLTGGGEFCSEAHRQKYQEEYNRLALSRLLQAQPQPGERPSLDHGRNHGPKNLPESPPAAGPHSRPGPAPSASPSPAAMVAEAAPAPPPPPRVVERPDPPQPGFLVERFEPVLSPRELFSAEPFLSPVTAFLPTQTNSSPAANLAAGEAVKLPKLAGGWNMALRPRERQVDSRDFTRVAPPIRLPLNGLRPDNILPEVPARRQPPFSERLLDVLLTSALAPRGINYIAPSSGNVQAIPEFRLNTASMLPVLLGEFESDAIGDLPSFSDAAEGEPIEPYFPDEDYAAATVSPVDAPAPLPEAPAEPVIEEPIAQAITGPVDMPEVVVDMSIFGEDPERASQPEAATVVPPAAEPAPEPAVAAEPLAVIESEPEPEASAPALEPEPAAILEIAAEPAPEPEALVAAVPVAEVAAPVAEEPVAEPEAPLPVEMPAPVAAAPRPRLADVPFAIEIHPAILASPQPAQILPAVAPANFRVACPTLDGVAVRPKMVYGARPEPKAASIPEPVPAPAAPEPAPKAQESGANSSRRDQRSVSQETGPEARLETPRPPSETPVPVAQPATPKAPPPPPPPAAAAPEPVKSKPKPEPKQFAGASTLNLDEVRLGLERSDMNARPSMGKKVAVGVGLVIALFSAGILLRATFAGKPAAPPSSVVKVEAVGPSLISNAGGWSSDWAGNVPKGPQISLFRPSLTLNDYRIEFQGQIENKSIGWVFRAVNPKNYYVTRIEMTKGGLQPTVVMAHYAVINGEEMQRVETPLPFPVQLDTVYKVRSDIYGKEFKTYVQGQLVDSWSDDRLKAGGFGLLSERGDRSQVRLIQLYELRAGE